MCGRDRLLKRLGSRVLLVLQNMVQAAAVGVNVSFLIEHDAFTNGADEILTVEHWLLAHGRHLLLSFPPHSQE